MTGMSPAPKPVGSARAAKPTRTPDPVRPLAGWIRQRRAHAIVGTLMVAALALVVWGQLAPKGDSVPLSIDNPGPAGAKAVAQILGRHGVDVHRAGTFEAAMDALGTSSSPTLLIYDSNVFLDDDRVLDLRARAGRVVLVSPRLRTLTVLDSDIRQAGVVPEASPVLEPGCRLPDAEAAGAVSGEAGFVYDGGTSCYHPPGASAGLLAVSGDSRLAVLGSAALLGNERLAERGHAALALRLLGASPDLVWYLPSPSDLEVSGPGRSLDELAPDWARFLGPWLVLAAMAAVAWRGRRLGPLVFEPLPVVVKAVETAEGRARLYHDSHAMEQARDTLRAGTLVRLSAKLRLGRGASADHVIDATASFLDSPVAGVRELINELPRTETRLVSWAQELDNLEKEVMNR